MTSHVLTAPPVAVPVCTPASRPSPARLVKAVADRVLAFVGLVVLLPVLVVLGLAVALTSRGPALFRQTRIGQDGRPFTLLKFRTMHVDAEAQLADLRAANVHGPDGVLFKVRDDPRVTRVGRWLRRTSLDELPQLVNVLTGRMSLVGPRPPLPRETRHYDEVARRRLCVKPGITGLWQVSGRSDLDFGDAVRLDLDYIANWSLRADAAILVRTAGAVVRGSGAY